MPVYGLFIISQSNFPCFRYIELQITKKLLVKDVYSIRSLRLTKHCPYSTRLESCLSKEIKWPRNIFTSMRQKIDFSFHKWSWVSGKKVVLKRKSWIWSSSSGQSLLMRASKWLCLLRAQSPVSDCDKHEDSKGRQIVVLVVAFLLSPSVSSLE